MRSPQQAHPDDPFTPSRAMRLRVAACRMWWRWPRTRLTVTAVVIAGMSAMLVFTAARYLDGTSHCVLHLVRGGHAAVTCR